MRLYDLTTPDHRLIASKKFEQPIASIRRLAHKVADEVVLQFTGERGIADTKIAYVSGPRGAKEIRDRGLRRRHGAASVDRATAPINLSPAWSPDARSWLGLHARTSRAIRTSTGRSRSSGVPSRPLAAFAGINSSPAFSPDGRSLALTLSK